MGQLPYKFEAMTVIAGGTGEFVRSCAYDLGNEIRRPRRFTVP